MNRRITVLAVPLAAALGAGAWGLSSVSASPPKSKAGTIAPRGGPAPGSTVVEGVISAYSGPSAFEGPVNDAGAYPAVYEINKAGGVLGHKFKVVVVDTRGDPADALPLIEKLLATQGNIVGLTGPSGNTGPTMIPIINKRKITMFSLAGESSFDRSTFQYFWRLLPPDPANGIALAIRAKQLGYKRVAAVFGTDSSAQGDLPGVLQGVKDLHLNLVANVSVTPDQPSYQADVAKLLAAHPQVILTEMDNTSAATFYGEMKQLGGVVPIIGTNADSTPAWISGVSSAMGVAQFAKTFSIVGVESYARTAANTAMVDGINHQASVLAKPLNQWYSEPYAAAAYDGVIVQALAMEAAHSLVPAVYNSFIPGVTEPGKGKTVVYTFAAGAKALQHGKKIQYIGASGPIVLNKWHNSYGNQVAFNYPTGNISSAHVQEIITSAQVAAAG